MGPLYPSGKPGKALGAWLQPGPALLITASRRVEQQKNDLWLSLALVIFSYKQIFKMSKYPKAHLIMISLFHFPPSQATYLLVTINFTF